MQEHVGDAKHVRELLLLDSVDGVAERLPVLRSPDLAVKLLEPARDEAARAAGEVGHLLAYLRLYRLRHEVRHGAGVTRPSVWKEPEPPLP